MFVRNGLATSALVMVDLARAQAMGQQLRSRRSGKSLQSRNSLRATKLWRSERAQNLWLSRLVDAMEEFSRPEWRAAPCDRSVLAAVRARLARPASACLPRSRFSLPN